MMRLGEIPKGIIGSGVFLGGVVNDEHYTEREKTAVYAPIQFDALVDPHKDKYLSLLELDKKFPSMKWTPQASGTSIRVEYIDALDELWGKRLIAQKIERRLLFEGAVRRVVMDVRERHPEARRQCIEHHGLNCVICGFNFGTAYGEVGEGLIHVHHLKPLGKTTSVRSVDPIKDLRPVCANCHAVIHRQPTPRTIEEMRNIVQEHRR